MRRSELIAILSTALLFIALEVISVVMVSHSGVVQRYRIMGAVRSSQTGMWNTTRKVQYFINYRVENEKLANENLLLHEEIERYKAAVASLDSVKIEGGYVYTLARVIKNSTNKQQNYIIINRGESDGIKVGMGVVTDNGVVGVVNATDRHYSQVISFLSAGQKVSAKIAKNGAFGPLAWEGHSVRKAHLSEIPAHTDVVVGDTISTSGFSTIYPPDIPLGKVTKVFDNGVSIDLNMELFQNFSALQHVYVVSNTDEEEIRRLDQ